MSAACPRLPPRGVLVGRLLSQAYQGDERQNGSRTLVSFSLARPVPFAALLSSLPHPGDCVHGRPGEQASETPSVEILHRETGDKVFGERLGATARLRPTASSTSPAFFLDDSGDFDNTMGDINDGHGDGAAATFPVAMYVLFLSYYALLLVPYSDLLDVLSLMCMVKYVSANVMLFSVIKLTRKLPNNLTIQKPDVHRQFSPSGFAAALKPNPFTGAHFKRWQTKTLLWLTSMGVHRVAEGTPRGPLTPDEDKAFREATVIFVGAVLSVLGDKLVDAYLHIRDGKELWDALDAKFGAADAGGELYAMEQFNDFRMVENRSVVE